MREKQVSTIELNSWGGNRFSVCGDAWANKAEPADGSLEYSWHRRWSYPFEYDVSNIELAFGLLVTMNGDRGSVTFHVGNTENDRKSHILFKAYLDNKDWIKSRGLSASLCDRSFMKSDWDTFHGPYPLGMSLVEIRGVSPFGDVTAGYWDQKQSLCVAYVRRLTVREVIVQSGIGRSAEILLEAKF